MVPENWTWNVLWDGPKVYDTYVASRFVHSLSVYPLDSIVKSITKIQVLKVAFVVLKWMGYDVGKIASRCKIHNLIIWRIIF